MRLLYTLASLAEYTIAHNPVPVNYLTLKNSKYFSERYQSPIKRTEKIPSLFPSKMMEK